MCGCRKNNSPRRPQIVPSRSAGRQARIPPSSMGSAKPPQSAPVDPVKVEAERVRRLQLLQQQQSPQQPTVQGVAAPTPAMEKKRKEIEQQRRQAILRRMFG